MLFFYPLASSPICTAQACHFRDLSNEFAEVGAQRVGISLDTVDKQAHFCPAAPRSTIRCSRSGWRCNRAVRDAPRQVRQVAWIRRGGWGGPAWPARLGVVALLARLLPVRRTTFVIDTDRTILKVVSSELRASVHADHALRFWRNERCGLVHQTSGTGTPTRLNPSEGEGRTDRRLVHGSPSVTSQP